MVENKLSIDIQGFRVINKAQINLNGITVVSGVNGCGKSSISKLLYYVFRNANNYNELVYNNVNNNILPYLNVLDQMQHLLIMHYNDIGVPFRKILNKSFGLYDLNNMEEYLDSINGMCKMFIELDNILNKNGNATATKRVKTILYSTLNIEVNNDLPVLLNILIEKISKHLSKAKQLIIERPYRLLNDSLVTEFNDDLSEKVVVKEYEDLIYEKNISNIPLLHYIKKVAYIDTPMMIGLNPNRSYDLPSYWEDLNSLLRVTTNKICKNNTYINNIIKEEIINGDVSLDDSFSERFYYKRNDGEVFDILECATGIKSFSLIQLLLKNCFIDENTLMIIDEPEAYLHPQWIVEYARLIVLLHKKIGVKFFITSHNPDMVSAIKYISKKEGVIDSLNFYIAKETKQDSGCYNYEDIGTDIEPIFKSFNISLDRIEEYGCYDEE